MGMIFDTHAHYDDQAFDDDRKELLSGLFQQGVGLVMEASAAARNMPQILQLTREYAFIYGSAGLHPCETYGCGDNMGKPVMYGLPEYDGQTVVCTGSLSDPVTDISMHQQGDLRLLSSDVILSDTGKSILRKQFSDDRPGGMASSRNPAGIEWTMAVQAYDPHEIITPDWTAGEREEVLIRAMLKQPKIHAVGEIGLDYHYEDTRKDVQKDWFARQIAIAREYGKPIFIHSRDAAADTLDMVKSEHAAEVGGIVHCFSYSKEMAAAYVDLGFLIGVGGVVTYKNAKKLKEVVSYLPIQSMVLETDCPYLAPTPFRGKRNDSTLIRYTAEAVAAIKGMPVEDVIGITEENARRVYRIETI